jgi:hypothetical protein
VTGSDTIICLTRGSGASLIHFRFHDSLTLDLLSDVDCSGITSRAIIKGTLVYCGMNQGGTGIEVWGISDPTSPQRLSYVYLPPVMDNCGQRPISVFHWLPAGLPTRLQCGQPEQSSAGWSPRGLWHQRHVCCR